MLGSGKPFESIVYSPGEKHTYLITNNPSISRDNVYSIYAVFGLALAYRRVDDDSGRLCRLTFSTNDLRCKSYTDQKAFHHR